MPLIPLQLVGDSSIYNGTIEVSQLVHGAPWLVPGATVATSGTTIPSLSVARQTVTASQFTDGAGASGTLNMTSMLPAGARVIASTITGVVGFTGNVSCAVFVGYVSHEDAFQGGAPSIFTTSAAGIDMGVPAGPLWVGAATTVLITITSDTDITPVIAGPGAMTVSVYYIATA